ncbi:MAG: hypothetical protein ACYC3L_01095 [Gemmatimonadaceae bacterium]
MPERAAYPPVTAPATLPEYVQLQNVRLGTLARQVARLQFRGHRIVTAAATLTEADFVVLCDSTAGNYAVTLPAAASVPGQEFAIKKTVAANTVTITPSGSDTIDGAATLAVTTQWQTAWLKSVITASPATWSWVNLSV